MEDVGTIDDATTVSGGVDSLSERDEIKEVREYNKEDNRNVQLWKIALMTLLAAFGVAITYTTYTFLKQEERDSFEVAVSPWQQNHFMNGFCLFQNNPLTVQSNVRCPFFRPHLTPINK